MAFPIEGSRSDWEAERFRASNGQELTLRHCRGMQELDACVQLQQQTWGGSDLETTPRKSFVLAQELGGQVIGAFDGKGRMVAFAMALAALEAPEPQPASGEGPQPYLHSHMLAVLPEYRDSGLGYRLKLAQRADAIGRGIAKMTWTFDPLAGKNAHFNLHKLGAIARRYSPDFYGVSSSRLQGGLATDRLHAEWWMLSARVRNHLEHQNLLADGVFPGQSQTIILPRGIEEWKSSHETLAKAVAVQSANRVLFLDAFARGLVVTDFRKDAEGNGVFVLEDFGSKQGTRTRTLHED